MRVGGADPATTDTNGDAGTDTDLTVDGDADAPGLLPKPAFRPDVDGLRAVAIVLVVAFHAGVPHLGGGFIGVDVFFVISGYLITRNLLSESNRSGGVSLSTFWAKRIRRLVPALALMVVVVLLAAAVVLPAPEWGQTAADGRAAALYVSNIAYANQSTDYFAGDLDSSLFLHTWSLSVEEQFYLVWPVAVALACLAVRRRRGHIPGALGAVFGVVLVGSFALDLVLTGDGSPNAFFGLPSRAWEFAAGGLLAVLTLRRGIRSPVTGSVLVAAGGALLAFGTIVIHSGTPYPGAWALIPVTGTLAVILGGGNAGDSNPLSTSLAMRPAQWVGRVSYTWYLWHWPMILLAVDWLDRPELSVRLGAAVAALGVAAVVHHRFETPLRFAPWLVRSRWRTYAFGAVTTLAVVGATFTLGRAQQRVIEDDDGFSALVAARDSEQAWPCDEVTSPSGITYCEQGDVTSDRTVVLTGDSYAGQWITAFDQAAAEEGIRLAVRWRGRCPEIPVAMVGPDGRTEDTTCEGYQADTMRLVDELDAVAVVGSHTTPGVASIIAEGDATNEQRAERWADAYQSFLETVGAERAVGVIVSTPTLVKDPIECQIEGDTPEECAPTPKQIDDQGSVLRQREAAERAIAGDVATFDIRPDLCGPDTCVVLVDGHQVYADNGHLTPEFTTRYVSDIREFLRELTGST